MTDKDSKKEGKKVLEKESKKDEISSEKNVATAVVEKREEKRSGGKKIDQVLDTISGMTLIELSDLVKAIEDKFDVSAAVPVMAAAAVQPGVAGEAATKDVEKTEFNVILKAIGEKKIQVIKEVRAITSLGLKEAKALVEEAPKPVKQGVLEKEAKEIKEKLEAVGATVEIE